MSPEEEFEETQTPRDGGSKVKGEGVLRARARERAEKEKEKMLDDALREVKERETETVGKDGIGEDEIRRITEEAKYDLIHEDCQVAPKEEITAVLDRLQAQLKKQAAVRDEATRERRIEIEEVIRFDREGGEQEASQAARGLDFKDLAYEPKQWAEEIGDVYQSGWEGNDEVWDGGEGEGEEGYKEEEKGEEKGEVKGKKKYEDDSDEEDKENTTGPSRVSTKYGNFMESMKMELDSAQSKAKISLERAKIAFEDAARS